jgi:hypothetical protein
MHRLTSLNCPTTVSGLKSFEQAATGRPFRILRSVYASNRAACQVMIDAAGPLSQDNPAPAHVSLCAWAGRLPEVLHKLVI